MSNVEGMGARETSPREEPPMGSPGRVEGAIEKDLGIERNAADGANRSDDDLIPRAALALSGGGPKLFDGPAGR